MQACDAGGRNGLNGSALPGVTCRISGAPVISHSTYRRCNCGYCSLCRARTHLPVIRSRKRKG